MGESDLNATKLLSFLAFMCFTTRLLLLFLQHCMHKILSLCETPEWLHELKTAIGAVILTV